MALKCMNSVTELIQVIYYIIMMRIDVKTPSLSILQVCLISGTSEVKEIIDIYAKVEKTISMILKNEQLIMIGDFSIEICENRVHLTCGKFRQEKKNECGDLLQNWLDENNFITSNTCFHH